VKNGLRHRKFPINCAPPLVCSEGKRLAGCRAHRHISRADQSESIFHFAPTQDVAFLRNSFNKFREAENILRPFLFSFVSGRRCRAARVQWALPIHI